MPTIRLFKGAKILEDENFIVENIIDYLTGPNFSSSNTKTFNIQVYDSSKMDVSIKIQAQSETDRQNEIDGNNYNYALVNPGTKRLFYFIRKISYIAPYTYQIDLHLDVLNSFYNKNYISPLTHITRQHKDRFKEYFIYGQGTFYFPYIDEYSEGLIPQLYKKEENVIYEELNGETFDISYYLVFKKSSSDAQPNVLIYLYKEDNTRSVAYGIESVSTPTSYIYGTIHELHEVDKKDSKLIKIIKIPYCPLTPYATERPDTGDPCYMLRGGGEWFQDSVTGTLMRSHDYVSIPLLNGVVENGNPSQAGTISDNILALNPLGKIVMNNNVISKNLDELRETNIQFLWEEPKLFHSDFYYWKYIYDSFVKVIAAEKYLNWLYTTDQYQEVYNRKITFVVTSTINSKFMFDFSFLSARSFDNEDYARFLTISRNNESTIYSDEYINYLRNGFNYDVKNKERQEAFSWFTTGLGIAGGLASVAFGSKTLGVAMISSSVMAIANSINTTIQLETNMEQKINQLKHQGMSVFGSDDVDLMTLYSHNNKLWRAKYEVSDRMKKALRDLFYYTGYVDDVTEIPVTNTRMWFNYLQCEIHFKSNPHMNKEQLEEFKGKFLGGVTFLHSNVVGGLQQWDFDRVKENWERVFFTNN